MHGICAQKNVNKIGAQNIGMQCQKIFQSYANIMMRHIKDLLDLIRICPKIEVYQAHN